MVILSEIKKNEITSKRARDRWFPVHSTRRWFELTRLSSSLSHIKFCCCFYFSRKTQNQINFFEFLSQPRRIAYHFHEIAFVKHLKCSTLTRRLELRWASPNNHAVTILGSQRLDEIPHVILQSSEKNNIQIKFSDFAQWRQRDSIQTQKIHHIWYFTLDMKLIESVYWYRMNASRCASNDDFVTRLASRILPWTNFVSTLPVWFCVV